MFILPERSEFALVTWVHGSSTWGPLSGADLAVLVCVLEGLDKSKGLVNVTTYRQVADGDVSDSTLGVNDVSSSECNSSILTILNEATVFLGNFLGHICNHGDVHFAEAAKLTVLLCVLHVGEVRVDGGTNDLAINCFKVF